MAKQHKYNPTAATYSTMHNIILVKYYTA